MPSRGLSSRDGLPKTLLFRVKWRLQLCNLEPNIRKLFANGDIDRQAALEIARVPDQQTQIKILQMINGGRLVGWKAVRNYVDVMLGDTEQADIFGDAAPKVTVADIQKVAAMEARIERAARELSGGWKDGECIIANRVDPSRASLIADKLAAISKTVRVMERELRNIAAQAVAFEKV
jgi:hypothetical protein